MWALLSALRVSRLSWLNCSQCLVFLVLQARLYSLCFLRVILRMELFIHGRWFLLLVVREGIYLSIVSCSFPLKMFQFSFTDLLGCSCRVGDTPLIASLGTWDPSGCNPKMTNVHLSPKMDSSARLRHDSAQAIERSLHSQILIC